ncbi:MAG: hypothetical protein DMENIID0002_01700 [Rickettsia endosymbiont of Sergentomyia squamirostris]|uniref:Major facilitator superfamily (MFS) profile domain-containing protein n=1 Tax=Candidatus Tisiphia endosymbiont of Sergentomyia squamirostris TaxID=3113639 RepID=A0AAT9G6T6_9RICK
MLGIYKEQISLTKEQKEAVGLLSIGSFLEYFDLTLYVHMAVLLNELFFESTDPHTASLMMAFTFCSTYVLRPVGALIFGWIGDTVGRKATVIITTFMMALSCFVMANLPTYAQIGVTASYVVTICRIMQGISSMGRSGRSTTLFNRTYSKITSTIFGSSINNGKCKSRCSMCLSYCFFIY